MKKMYVLLFGLFLLYAPTVKAEQVTTPEETVVTEQVTTPEETVVTEQVTAPEETVVTEQVTTPEETVVTEQVTTPEETVVTEQVTTPEETVVTEQVTAPEEIAATSEISTMSYPTPVGQIIWKTTVLWTSSEPPFSIWYDDGTFQGFLYIQNKWYGGGNYRTNYGGLVRKYSGMINL